MGRRVAGCVTLHGRETEAATSCSNTRGFVLCQLQTHKETPSTASSVPFYLCTLSLSSIQSYTCSSGYEFAQSDLQY